jgi:chromosome segregation ATPase
MMTNESARLPRVGLAIRLTLAFACSIWPALAHADSDMEARMRDQFRQAVTQLRSLQDENSSLQAQKADSDKKIQSLNDQLKDAQQKIVELTASAQKSTAAAAAEQEAALLRAQLEKSQSNYQQAVAAGQTAGGERDRLKTELAATSGQAQSCAAKNATLFKLGNTILDAYEHKGFGEVLGENEPFTGLKRVELENAYQDYQNKLRDQRVSAASLPARP